MMTVTVDRTRNIVLLKFSAALTIADMDGLDNALSAYSGAIWDAVIVDLSEVTRLEVPADVLSRRAMLPPVLFAKRKLFVGRQNVVYGVSRLFRTHRRHTRRETVEFAETLEEAFRLLSAPPETACPADANR